LYLAQIAKEDEAKALIDQVYKLTKEDIIKQSFVDYAEFSKLYRTVGAEEQAEGLMRDYIQRTDNRTCSSFHRPRGHANCATELVYLGYSDTAYKKAFKACKKNTNCGPVTDMYYAAIETNVALPALSDMLNSISDEHYTDMLIKLSVVHFNQGDLKTGNTLLEKAIIAMQKTYRFGEACKLGYLSLLTDRHDLLNPIFSITIRTIYNSDINAETKKRAFYKTHECFEKILN